MRRALSYMVFVLVFAVCGTTAFAGSNSLKTPYLIYPGTNTTMMVLWQDVATATDTLFWGTNPACNTLTSTTRSTCSTASVSEVTSSYPGAPGADVNSSLPHQHIYTITGLTPNTRYYYLVSNGSTVYGSGSFITAPAATATSVKFLAIGDTRTNMTAMDGVMQAMNSFISQPGNAEYQRLTIHNGDWVASDTESSWTQQWFLGSSAPDVTNFTANSPIQGCKGNHENTVPSAGTPGYTALNPNGYVATFPKYFPYPYPNLSTCTTATCGATSPVSGDANFYNLYWSFDYGPVHFTILDEYSSFAPGSAQYKWLVNDLSSTKKPWKILIYHEPAYNAGTNANNTAAQQLEPLVSQYGVDLTYSGHSHSYARAQAYSLAQANGDRQIALNVPHITSGGGGAPINPPDFTNTGNWPHVVSAWQAFEFMAFNVQGNTLEMTAYQVNGVSTSNYPSKKLTFSPIETIVLNHFTNVTSQVAVTASPVTCQPTAASCTVNLTVKNNGQALTGSVDLVLDNFVNLLGIGNANNQYSTGGLNGTGSGPVTSKVAENSNLVSDLVLSNATGTNNGEPMVRISRNGLGAGASVVVPLKFVGANSSSMAVTSTIGETITGNANGTITITTKNDPNTSPANAPVTVNPIVYVE
jgi:predicted phosphodiesterase